MHQQYVAGRKIRQEVFRATTQSLNRLAVQLLGKALWQRPAQIAATHLDFGKARAFHDGRQTAAHGFDFRQFGHWLTAPALTHSALRPPALWSCPKRTIGHASWRRPHPFWLQDRAAC